MQLSVILPCYNEEEVLEETSIKPLSPFNSLIESSKIDKTSTINFIDDGSSDSTWGIIEALSKKNKHISGIKLSHNFGHPNALLAGIFNVEGDAIISIDAVPGWASTVLPIYFMVECKCCLLAS